MKIEEGILTDYMFDLISHGKKQSTARMYAAKVSIFVSWLIDNDVTEWEDVKPTHIQKYIEILKVKAQSTFETEYAALRSFSKYAEKKSVINFTFKIHRSNIKSLKSKIEADVINVQDASGESVAMEYCMKMARKLIKSVLLDDVRKAHIYLTMALERSVSMDDESMEVI